MIIVCHGRPGKGAAFVACKKKVGLNLKRKFTETRTIVVVVHIAQDGQDNGLMYWVCKVSA